MVDILELSKQVFGQGIKADMAYIELVDRKLDIDESLEPELKTEESVA